METIEIQHYLRGVIRHLRLMDSSQTDFNIHFERKKEKCSSKTSSTAFFDCRNRRVIIYACTQLRNVNLPYF